MRRLIVGDIHNNFKGLIQALRRAGFNKEEDVLYGVGDYVDGHSQAKEVIEFLLSINFEGVIGNHDYWMREWIRGGFISAPHIWYSQGGKATLESYGIHMSPQINQVITNGEIPHSHVKFFENLKDFIVTDDDCCIVHGGLGLKNRLEKGTYDLQELIWDRASWHYYDNRKTITYKKVFIGHTALKTMKPQLKKNMWNLDTGGGWKGKITIMNMDTEEYWQSDTGDILYPDFKGR